MIEVLNWYIGLRKLLITYARPDESYYEAGYSRPAAINHDLISE